MVEPDSGYRLSPAQEQAWDTAGARQPARARLVARVAARLHPRDVASALAAATVRHQALRTTFVTPAGARRPLQVIAEPGTGTASALEVEVMPLADGHTRLRLEASSLNADVETLRLVLCELVATCCHGAAAGLPDPGIPYVNVCAWHHDLLAHEESAEVLEWWRQRIDMAAAALDSRDAGPLPSGPCQRLPFEVPRAVGERLEGLAVDRQLASMDIVLALWLMSQSWFARSGQAVVAWRFDGRFSPELEGIVGPASRFLPLLAHCAQDVDLLDLVARLSAAREQGAERQEYYYPSPRQQDPLLTGRVTAFAWLDRVPTLDVAGTAVRIEEQQVAFPGCCPCALQCTPTDGGLSGLLQYDRTLPEFEVAARLEAFLTSLEWGLAHPQGRLRSMSPVSTTTRQRALASAPPAPAPFDGFIADLVREHARAGGERPAAFLGERRLDYGELDARVEHLAATLASAGVGPECAVGVAMDGCPEAVVALLAILRAGAVYVPLAPDDPPARLHAITSRLRISVVLATAAYAQRLPQSTRVFEVDLAAPVGPPPVWPRPVLLRDNGAYVIHTSGSTGEARPVLVSHATLLASTRARQAYYNAPVDRFLLVSPLVFDSSIAGLFWTLADGGALVFPQERPPNPDELRTLVAARAVTHVLGIPRLLHAVAEHAPTGALASLRCAIVAGEACPRDIAEVVTAAAPGCAVFNEYGVSEAGVWSTVQRVTAADGDALVPIGEPIPGARVYVCGDELQWVPQGAVGELCVGGLGLARGYAHLPGATAARFVPDPHAETPGARLYRTGDLVRASSPGVLSFVGRSDHQVKVRGQRLDLEQVEALVRAELPVAEVVAVLTGPAASPGLGVFYRPRPTHALAPDALRAFLEARLPAGLAPARVMALDALPRTATGKVDRFALAHLAQQAPEPLHASPPRTAVERSLADIWAQVFGLPEVSRDQDFLALGGDSIVALQITARARAVGLALTPRQVLACRTIATLATEAGVVSTAIAHEGGVPARLTPIQRWFFAERFADQHHHNQSLLMEAPHTLDLAALETAIHAVVALHPALHTVFEQRDEQWWPRRDPAARVRLQHVDVSQLAPAARATQVEQVLAETQGGFDLGRAPLLRVVVLDYGVSRPLNLLFAAHHLVIDGLSWRVLLDDLAAAYAATSRGVTPSLPAASLGVEQWAALLEQRAQDPGVRDAARYWSTQAMEPSTIELPVDHPGGSNLEGDAATLSLRLEPDQARLLRGHQADGGPDALLLSALGRALEQWCEREATWVALERHGRDAEPGFDLDRTVGWLTAVFPFRLGCPRALSTHELVASVSAELARLPKDAWLHGYLRHATTDTTGAALAAQPWPWVSFNNLGRVHTAAAPGLPLRLVEGDRGRLRSARARRAHLLDVTVTTQDEALIVVFTYSAALHARRTIERLGQRMLALLEELCAAAV